VILIVVQGIGRDENGSCDIFIFLQIVVFCCTVDIVFLFCRLL
jgi:hypothetical protein